MGLKKAIKKASKSISSAVKKATSGTGIGSEIKKAIGETTAKAIGTENAAKLGHLMNVGGKATSLATLGTSGLATSWTGRAMEKPLEEEQAEEERRQKREEAETIERNRQENISALEKSAELARRQTRTDYTSMSGLLGDYQLSEDDALSAFRKRKSL